MLILQGKDLHAQQHPQRRAPDRDFEAARGLSAGQRLLH